jgi:3-hydroxyisobutyrate dehydrogenase
MEIGIAGTGKMGSAIAKRLIQLGHTVYVWNRTVERAKPLIDLGAHWVATPQQLSTQVSTIISIVTDEAAMDQVYLSPKGLISADVSKNLFIDMSTVKPAQQQKIGEAAIAKGAAYVECPVGGSVGPASEGKLLGFAGGLEKDFLRAKPILDLLCKRAEHLGALGSGETMKLAINLPLMVYWQTLGEALSLIDHLKLDPKLVVDLFTESSGGPNMLKVRGGMITNALAGVKNEMITVNVATMRKDLRTMLDQGQSLNRQMPLTAQSLANFDKADASGLSSADCTQLLVWWLANGKK